MTKEDPSPTLPVEIEQAFLSMLDLPASERQVAFDVMLARWREHAPRLRAWMTEVNASGTAAEPPNAPIVLTEVQTRTVTLGKRAPLSLRDFVLRAERVEIDLPCGRSFGLAVGS